MPTLAIMAYHARGTSWFGLPTALCTGQWSYCVPLVQGEIVHLELWLPDGQAFTSILSTAGPKLEHREFGSNEGYVRYEFEVSDREYTNLRAEIDRMLRRRASFASVRGWFAMLPLPFMASTGDTYFCSEAIATVLRDAHLLPDEIRPEHMYPSRLHKLLCQYRNMRATPSIRGRKDLVFPTGGINMGQ